MEPSLIDMKALEPGNVVRCGHQVEPPVNLVNRWTRGFRN